MAGPRPPNSVREHLADRIRTLLGDDPRIVELAMFGSLAFLLNGHILVGAHKDGSILLSVGRENNAEALGRPGATQMVMRDRAMLGFIEVDADAIEDDSALADWLRFAERSVAARPPK